MCRIPVERFIQLVQPHVEKKKSDDPSAPAGINLLADVLDVKLDSLQKILWGYRKSIEFDLAERILIELGIEHLWHTDEELNRIYMNAPLDSDTIIYMTDLQLGTECPNGHIRTEENTKITGRGALTCTTCLRERAPKKGWKKWEGYCPNGHERTPENTRMEKDGPRCRACYLNRLRESKARKKAMRDPVVRALMEAA